MPTLAVKNGLLFGVRILPSEDIAQLGQKTTKNSELTSVGVNLATGPLKTAYYF